MFWITQIEFRNGNSENNIGENLTGCKQYCPAAVLALFLVRVINRQWDFYYVLTQIDNKSASVDVDDIFIAYNFRRILNMVGQSKLKQFFGELVITYLEIRLSIRPF